jgi:hypothetical protein
VDRVRTRIKLDFVLEHDGDRMLPLFNTLAFIEGGIRAACDSDSINAIDPGARASLSIVRVRRNPSPKKRTK